MIFKETKIIHAFRILLDKAETEPSFFQRAWRSNALAAKKGAK
jgi:hypothetical protein